MKHGLIVLVALAVAAPALAQSAPVAPASPSTAAVAAPAAGPDEPDQSPGSGVKALRASCREEARSQRLSGPARREAVSACVVRQRPDLAGREQCRTEGLGKGLRREELHAFVKDCSKAKG